MVIVHPLQPQKSPWYMKTKIIHWHMDIKYLIKVAKTLDQFTNAMWVRGIWCYVHVSVTKPWEEARVSAC